MVSGLGVECRIERFVLSDFPIDFFSMVVVIRECVVDSCKGEMGIMSEQLVRSLSVEQDSDDHGPNGDPGSVDPRTPPADLWITYDMGMCDGRHGESVADFLDPGNYPMD